MAEQSSAREERLNQALLEYRQCVDRGVAVDLPRLLGRYADVAADLREYLETEAALQKIQNAVGLGNAAAARDARKPPLELTKYRILRPLGRGGMGQVFLAEHIHIRRQVAIKVLPELLVEDRSYLQRFLKEARVIASLDHPNIVHAYECDNVGKTYYLAMEYIEGEDLEQLTKKKGPWPFRSAAEFARQAAEGLAYAHQRGIIHRDIKPSNLLVTPKGAVKILDLGLALTSQESSSLTQQHGESVLGTTDYMSPEQAVDSHRVDGRSDIYSLGCTLYYLLTGEPPFPRGTIAEKLAKHQLKEPASLREKRPDVPAPLADICRKMMAKNPEQRYRSAGELQADLARWLQSGAPPARESALAWKKSWRRWLPALAGACVLALLAAGLWSLLRSGAQGTNAATSSSAPTSTQGQTQVLGPGRFGNGLICDGFSTAAERLSLSKDLNPPQFTVMAWIKIGQRDPRAPSEPMRYVFFTDAVALGVNEKNCLFASVTNGDGVKVAILSEDEALKPDRWHHIAVSFNGDSLQTILDAKPKGSRPIGKPRTNLPPVQGFIGQGQPNERFIGVIDEVRLYKRALSRDEVKACGSEPKPAMAREALLAQWTFD